MSPLICICTVLLAAGTVAAQNGYQYTIFDEPHSNLTHPYAINDNGTVVGSYYYGDHGFERTAAGNYSTIDFPGASDNLIRGINDHGVMVGKYRLSGFDYSFSYANGVFTTLPKPGTNDPSGANGINNAGVVVGSYREFSTAEHGYIYQNNIYTTVDYPGAAHTTLVDINDSGIMLGNYWNGSRWLGFLYDGVDFTPLEMPGAYWTYVAGFNNFNQIVGQRVDASGANRTAILYDNGVWIDLQVPGATSWTGAQDINDAGVITGYMYENNFAVEHGFLAEPAPAFGISLTGGCPNVQVDIHDATPNGQVAVLYATGMGNHSIPLGMPCEGTALLLNPSAALGGIAIADVNGNAFLARNVPPSACGNYYLQALDLGSCQTSNVVLMQ